MLSCIILVFTACSARAFLTGKAKDEVIFVREYRDYGWRYYGSDSVKLAKPLQILLGVYLVEYKLNASSLLIRKRTHGSSGAQAVLFTQVLGKVDSRLASQRLAATQPAQLVQRCQAHPQDDGFHLNVTLTKGGSSTSFRWNGSYEADLVDLLALVNKLAPEKYKFYKPGQQEAFNQSLLHAADAP